MSIHKQYLKSKPVCKVTFKIDGEIKNSANKAHLVGEFNNWSISASPMKPLKNGGFAATLKLEKDKEYQFRYLLDQQHWENDPNADKFVSTPYGDSQNSVIVL